MNEGLTEYERIFVKRPTYRSMTDFDNRINPICPVCLSPLDGQYRMKCKCEDGHWVHEAGTGAYWMWVPEPETVTKKLYLNRYFYEWIDEDVEVELGEVDEELRDEDMTAEQIEYHRGKMEEAIRIRDEFERLFGKWMDEGEDEK